jgi:hypothetical protein
MQPYPPNAGASHAEQPSAALPQAQQPYPAPAYQPYPPQAHAPSQPYPAQQYPPQAYPTQPQVQPEVIDPSQPRCGMCGAVPAKKVAFQGFAGLIFALSIRWYRGYACKTCGTAVSRDLDARTMAFGWWVVYGPLVVVIGLLANALRRRGLAKLAEPWGAQHQPMALGLPAYQRPGPLVVTIIMSGLWLLLLSLIVISAVTSA